MRSTLAFLLALPLLALAASAAEPKDDAAAWTVYVANDNCPDYTWGLTEEQTRQAFADIVRGHLDEMNRTDKEPLENRDRYNMAVTQEALCFVEKYPDRKDELIRRIKEGRVFVSPYLCNSLWGMASVEQTIRTLYPARRLEREWGIPKIEWAEHIEEPSLPWGTATILAGCGIRWLSNPFYNYDSTFAGLKNPPLFIYEGPDGSRLRVVMDPWASNKASYTQGAKVLANPQTLLAEWLPHYRSLGAAYPVRAILASGTHGDINPGSGNQARGFAEKLAKYNASPGEHPKLVNATLPMFCRAVDEAQARTPFLPTVRGDFGYSWDAWPVSLAKYVAAMREGERQFLAAEALVAVAGLKRPELYAATRADRERAEWCLAMLSDHAWNGTDEKNQRHNAALRRQWSEDLEVIGRRLLWKGWQTAAPGPQSAFSVFNPQGFRRRGLVGFPWSKPCQGDVICDGKRIPAQYVPGMCRGDFSLWFVSPELPAYSAHAFTVAETQELKPSGSLRATATELESPFYRIRVDLKTGGLASVVHKPTGMESVQPGKGRSLGQMVYFSGGKEHTLEDVRSTIDETGPVRAGLRISGKLAGMPVVNSVTLYADLDRIDVVLFLRRAETTAEDRLCHVFPVMCDGAVLRVETPGAVVRPKPQPEGDLLPGADTRRLAVQGFVDVSMPSGPGVTIAPLDTFLLRQDLDPLSFEAFGNDQNYKEVVKDQGGSLLLWCRYVLRVHAGPYDRAEAVAWSRDVALPLIAEDERQPPASFAAPPVEVDPARAIATCFKPADDPSAGGVILRLWETAGKAGPVAVWVRGFKRVILTDLLERDIKELKIEDERVQVDMRPHGFAAVRLLP